MITRLVLMFEELFLEVLYIYIIYNIITCFMLMFGELFLELPPLAPELVPPPPPPVAPLEAVSPPVVETPPVVALEPSIPPLEIPSEPSVKNYIIEIYFML